MNIDYLYGLVPLDFWGYVLVTFLLVQFTFMGVTLYLHRDACHRSIDLHPALRHVFRFWLWMASGMSTAEWVAVHRKHHARCETEEDPHSPVIFGLKKVLLEGAELYRDAARTPGLIDKYGRGTPDDWMERNVYRRHRMLGIALLVVVDLLLFGVPGIIILSVQLLAVPLMAAGVINGLGHHTGYRNFECTDAARNLVPWGVLVGGEELHNNHHAFPSSAKFSLRSWEFDIGWMYICVLRALGLAKVRRVAPSLARDSAREEVDLDALRAVLINRMHVLRDYAKHVTGPIYREQLKQAGDRMRGVKKLLIRETTLLDAQAHQQLKDVLASNASLRTVYEYRERLNALWTGAHTSNERLLQHLRAWIVDAEQSGIAALQDYARAIRGASVRNA